MEVDKMSKKRKLPLEQKIGKPEGVGTHRSEGSNKRAKYLFSLRDCRKQHGKGCRKKS